MEEKMPKARYVGITRFHLGYILLTKWGMQNYVIAKFTLKFVKQKVKKM